MTDDKANFNAQFALTPLKTNNGKIKANNATFPTDFLPITQLFKCSAKTRAKIALIINCSVFPNN